MRRRRAEWRRLVDEQRESGESQAGFARRRGLSVSTLRYWVQAFRREAAESEGAFVEVSVTEGSSASSGRPGRCRVSVGAVLIELDEVPSVEWLPCASGLQQAPRSARERITRSRLIAASKWFLHRPMQYCASHRLQRD